MDPATLGILPQFGVGGALLAVIIYLLRQNHADRRQYRQEILDIQTAHGTEVTRLSQIHASQLEDVKSEIVKWKTAQEVTNALYEDERQKRREAEDDAAKWRRRATIAEDENEVAHRE